MSQSTVTLDLPLIQEAQAQKHVIHNEAILKLDSLVQPVALDMDRTEPPATPAEGDRHLVAQGATGDWAGQDGALAVFVQNGWMFHVPAVGWRIHVLAEGGDAIFGGATWRVEAGGGVGAGDTLDTLGVNAAADTVNRLAVAAPATLLTNEGGAAGGDHRLKINKAAAADTNSLLFQTGWSGRAEMGCAGDDGFSVRVSADGMEWTTALRLDPATGTADGAAVQQAADDITPGRLMRADWGYGPGNLLAPVVMAGSTPAGGVLESGETAEGSYLKLANGTLICWGDVRLGHDSSLKLEGHWTFPVPFAHGMAICTSAQINLETLQATPSITKFGALVQTGLSVNSVSFQQYRVAGHTTFEIDDEVYVRAFAIGRWV